MTLQNQSKLAKHVLRLLKVQEIIIPICRTSKGNFGLRYSTNTDDYEMYLDAVPLSTSDMLKDENNIELKKMLDKYLFEQGIGERIINEQKTYLIDKYIKNEGVVAQDKPKRGRPIGSKNGTRTDKKS